jgi:ferredoxin-thioredoxin reductase catalytic subunit
MNYFSINRHNVFLIVATVQFQFDQYYVNESDARVRVAVVLNGNVDENVVVRYDSFGNDLCPCHTYSIYI